MSKSNLGNPIKEGCLLLGLELLEVSEAVHLATWATKTLRYDEATAFLKAASMQISRALAADFMTTSDAEEMRGHIKQYGEAIRDGKTEKSLQILADLSVKSLIVTFDKVVECECKRSL